MGEKPIINQRAINSINSIFKYISEEGYPEQAKKLVNDLYDFAFSLADTADSLAFCRHKAFFKRKQKCIPYKKNYIFIVSVNKRKVVTIHNIVPAKKIR